MCAQNSSSGARMSITTGTSTGDDTWRRQRIDLASCSRQVVAIPVVHETGGIEHSCASTGVPYFASQHDIAAINLVLVEKENVARDHLARATGLVVDGGPALNSRAVASLSSNAKENAGVCIGACDWIFEEEFVSCSIDRQTLFKGLVSSAGRHGRNYRISGFNVG